MAEIVLNTFRVKEGHCPHSLGAQVISSYCASRGYNVELMSSTLDVEKATKNILSNNPRICGLSSNYVTEHGIIEISKRIKETNGDRTLIVIGGPSVTYSSPESRIRKCEADLFVKGDGEEPFYQIIQNNPKRIIEGKVKIPGVSSKTYSDESIASINLEDTVSPFPIKFDSDHVYWETVRGCSFNCIYCAHPGQKGEFRNIPMERLVQEADYLSNKKFRAVYITDPILGGTKERSRNILRLLKKIRGSFITAEYRPEYLDEEVMDLLEDAQIGWLEFGLQTTNQALNYFRNNAQSSLRKLEALSKRNVKYSLDLIAGIPGDVQDTFIESLRNIIEEIRPTLLKVFPLRIYEGTALHQMIKVDKSIEYDATTRIIKKSHTFDEQELKKWLLLGRTTEQFYRFFQENNWFNQQASLRNINFFINCAEKFGQSLSEVYNPIKVKEIWEKIQNEK